MSSSLTRGTTAMSAPPGRVLGMYPTETRAEPLALLEQGASLSAVARRLGVNRSTLRAWRADPARALARRHGGCFRCAGTAPDVGGYAALLGYYLGDGCLSAHPRCHVLRISCDARLPGIVADVTRQVRRVHPAGRVHHVPAPGAVVCSSGWQHWPCLFPQHGPGRKHERRLGMQPWQWALVERAPADFLRGLFHSDGCRIDNWATARRRDGQVVRYEYGRWEFKNHSTEIMAWCERALDLVGIPWRRPSPLNLAVSRREGVERLDAMIGPKT